MNDLHLGDCLEILPTLPDASVDMVMCDPPYGTTQCKWDSVIPLEPMWAELRRIVKPKGAMVFTAAQPFTSALVMSNPKAFRYTWVWNKKHGTGFLNAKKRPLPCTEDVVVFSRESPRYYPQMRQGFRPYTQKHGSTKTKNYGKQPGAVSVSSGERYPVNILEFLRDKDKIHPTQKPVALMEYMIRTYTQEGETVLDFTMGSGTAGVACVNTGRRFVGIEMDAEYFEIAKKRIADADT